MGAMQRPARALITWSHTPTTHHPHHPQGVVLDLEEGPAAVEDESEREALAAIISNSRLSECMGLGGARAVLIISNSQKKGVAGGRGIPWAAWVPRDADAGMQQQQQQPAGLHANCKQAVLPPPPHPPSLPPCTLPCCAPAGEHYLSLARDLDVMEPKLPEDVYKTHLTGAWCIWFHST